MTPPQPLSVGRVLCATTPDMDPFALCEADRAARTLGAGLTVLSVTPPRRSVHAVSIRDKPSRAEQEDVAGHLDRLITWTAAHTGRSPHEFQVVVERGDPEVTIVERARADGADLVVVGTHDRTGFERWVLGSVAEAVVRGAPCPVLVTRGGHANDGPILAACDLAESSPPVLRWAGALAKRWFCSLTAIHAIQVNMSDVALVATALFSGAVPVQPDRDATEAMTEAATGALRAELASVGAEGIAEVDSGPPADVILARARSMSASLIVLGTHSRKGIARLFLGSVAEKIVREAPCAVLVVR